MRTRTSALIGAYAVLLCCLPAFGQMAKNDSSAHPVKTSTDDDTVAILEVGAATNWNFNGGAATFAPNLAAECTPIENWLELEAGVSPFYTRNSTEWDTDLLFKKPWDISKKSRVHAGSRTAMGTSKTTWQNERYLLCGTGGRLYVLADGKASLRMVPGTCI